LALAGGVADEIENASNLLLVRAGWEHVPNSSWFHTLAWMLWFAGWTKWLLYLGAVLAVLVVGWVLLAGHSGSVSDWWSRVRPQLHVLRLHIVVSVLVVIIFFAHEQMPDLVRRWTPKQLVLNLTLATLLVLVVW